MPWPTTARFTRNSESGGKTPALTSAILEALREGSGGRP